jgi:hypothetical protein
MTKIILQVVSLCALVCLAVSCATVGGIPAHLYTVVDTIIAADEISAETTSMLIINRDIDIVEFDGKAVMWRGFFDSFRVRGVIIPTGEHTVVVRLGEESTRAGSYWYESRKYLENETFSGAWNFEPGQLYEVKFDENVTRGVNDDRIVCYRRGQEKNSYSSLYKKQMEAVIAQEEAAFAGRANGLEGALQQSARALAGSLNRQEIIAIVGISSPDKDTAQFVVEELEIALVKNRFNVVDRNTLDRIRREQQFQLSGEVNDDSAVSIGKFVGAKVVIVGSISGSGTLRRLRLRALNVETALITTAVSEAF